MSQENQLYYSIIIPSFNRSEELDELLTSISKLEFDISSYEVIVSDDGSTDNTSELVMRFKDTKNFNLVYLSQENNGPGAARNHAMEKARGQFFIFIDSDVTMASNWLRNIDEKIKTENADAFGGPDSFKKDFPPLLKAINYTMTSFITTGGLRGKKGKKLAKFYPRSFNMGLSKNLYKKIGGFGSLRHGQDIEYSNRIIKSGAKMVFISNAPVFHKRRTSLKRFFKQVFNWGMARINLYKIDPAMLEPLHAAPAAATLLIVLLIFLPFLFPSFQLVSITFLILAVIIIIFSIIDSSLMYRSIKPGLWLPLVMPAQILGYGSGFIFNFFRRIVLKKDEKTGFKKNYYK